MQEPALLFKSIITRSGTRNQLILCFLYSLQARLLFSFLPSHVHGLGEEVWPEPSWKDVLCGRRWPEQFLVLWGSLWCLQCGFRRLWEDSASSPPFPAELRAQLSCSQCLQCFYCCCASAQILPGAASFPWKKKYLQPWPLKGCFSWGDLKQPFAFKMHWVCYVRGVKVAQNASSGRERGLWAGLLVLWDSREEKCLLAAFHLPAAALSRCSVFHPGNAPTCSSRPLGLWGFLSEKGTYMQIGGKGEASRGEQPAHLWITSEL